MNRKFSDNFNNKVLSIVVVGWEFRENVYSGLIKERSLQRSFSEVKYYIASHRQLKEIDSFLLNKLKRMGWRVLFFENRGWDWGAYQQFIKWQITKEKISDYYLFLHDDIKIKKYGFLEAFFEKIKKGAKVIGNSFPYPSPLKRNWKEESPHIFYWAKKNGWEIKKEKWKCVRGSCFFTCKDVAAKVLFSLPIKHGFHKGFGNWSVKLFAGKVAELYGDESVDYLSTKLLESEFIKEEYRGGSKKEKIILIKRKIMKKMPSRLKRIFKYLIKKEKSLPAPLGLKLNLGCGDRHMEGYLNIDINSEKADIKEDILNLEFDKESIAEVVMIHVIEHIDCFKVEPFLKKVYFWLMKNGRLVLEFPDVVKTSKLVLKHKNGIEVLQKSPFGIRGFYGEPKEDMSIYDYHKWGWSEDTMKFLLKKIGFRKVFIEKPHFHGKRVQRDARIVAIK